MSKYDCPYVVISGDQIAPLPNPGFPAGGYTEEDFRALLEGCQDWFQDYPNGGTAEVNGANLSCVFEGVAQAITVHRAANGQYTMATNGRHRLYVARKYGLSLLVCVMP